MISVYWFEIYGEDSVLCGEEFFTQLEDAQRQDHIDYAAKLFPNEKIKCFGRISLERAEMMGIDTY